MTKPFISASERGAPQSLPPRIYTVPRDGDGPRAAVPGSLRSPADERLHRKQQLAASLRLLARHGVEPGLAGHLSARDPERLDHF